MTKHLLVGHLQERSSSFEVQSLQDLLVLLLDETKDALLDCEPGRFPALQGRAQAYDGLLRLLRRQAILPKE